MCLMMNSYKHTFLHRFDKDEVIPYYCAGDFPDLECEEGAFVNDLGAKVRYYLYDYAGYDPTKLVLLCPGMGPGHTGYLTEIERLCRAGYRVLTLDYMGCDRSEGDAMPSVNQPTKDVLQLLDHLKPQEEVVLWGHSLGGYTALNVIRLSPAIKRAVIISGFVDIESELLDCVKLRCIIKPVTRYERKANPEMASGDNVGYLRATRDRILWIHSTDDPVVNYRNNAGKVEAAGNPNVKMLTVEGKRHTPHYSAEGLAYMTQTMGGYARLVKENKGLSLEDKQRYFEDKPIARMTDQDPAVWEEILATYAD